MTDELTRLRSALEMVRRSDDLSEARLIAAEALAPPARSREYAEAQTLADLTPGAWRIVGRQRHIEHRGAVNRYTFPDAEISTFRDMLAAGRIITTQARAADGYLILARRVRDVPTARGARR